MSTYIPGVTDYIPQIQPFKPNLNFFAGALQMKQTQYDTNHKQLSNFYGSLLNAPMLRDGNIQAREDYLKAIDSEIKKISSLDLSLQENVDAAANLFNGLYENENIVKDMVWTRNYNKELKRADGFRNCTDPEKCGGAFWEGGVRALNYKAMEFRNASDEQAMRFGNVRFTPYQNVMEKAIKYAKDAGLNITVDQLQGRYITTTKNGPMLIDPLNSLFTGLFANDQAIQDYYQTQAYVNRKDWVQSNIPVYGSEGAAEQAYIDQVSMGLNQMFGQTMPDVEARYNNISGQKRYIEQKIRDEGVNPNSTLADQYRQLNDLEGQVNASKDYITNAYGSYGNAMDPEQRAFLGENIDKAMASMLLGNDIMGAAQTLAYKDYEFKMKADPYALENVKQANRIALEDHKFENRKLFEKFKYDLKKWDEKMASQGSEIDNIPILKKIVEGGADINLEEGMAHKIFRDKQGNLQLDISGNERSILKEMVNLTIEQSKIENGQGVATDDLVKLGEVFFTQLMDNDLVIVRDGELSTSPMSTHDVGKMKAEWDGKSYDEKVKFMQSTRIQNILDNANISGTALDNIYNDFALPLMDQSKGFNSANRNYLGNLWVTSADQRKDIQNKNSLLQDMGEWYINESNNVIQNMKASESTEPYAYLMNLFIDPQTGAKRSAGEFASNYMNMYKYHRGSMTMDELYQRGLDLYSGEADISDHVGPRGELEDMTLSELWAKSFSEHMSPDGGAIALGLIGSDSNAAMGLNFPAVDPSKFASSGTMNTISMFQDVYTAGEENYKIKIGGPSEALPGSTDANAEAFFDQLYKDMINMKDADNNKRPILNVTYQDIAGGNEEWTALNVKVNSPYLSQYLGSEKAPGLTRGIDEKLRTDGFTIYLNKSNAQNGFRMGVDKSPVEQTMYYTGKYDFDAYPEYTRDLRLTPNPDGGYLLKGQVMSGYKEDGTKDWNPIYVPYTSLATDPTSVVAEVNAWLDQIATGNDYMTTQYNNENGIHDPNQLLNP